MPLIELTPVRKRTARQSVFDRLEANIRAVGLLEPLLIYEHHGQRFIIDGYLRYQVLKQIGITSAPCIILDTLDLYTPNRQVSYLSRSQHRVMLERALTVVDEQTLAKSLGLNRIRRGFKPSQLEFLSPEVLKLAEEGKISHGAALHFIHVSFDRQRQIISAMTQAGDMSGAFIRTQVLNTAPEERNIRSERGNPWSKITNTRQKLMDRLVEAERRHDYYHGVYREYASDLVKLAIYVRQMTTVKAVKDLIQQAYPSEWKLFQQIVMNYADAVEG